MIHSHVCDIEKMSKEALAYAFSGIKHLFKLDTVSYAWVKDFVKDQDAREKIEAIRKSIQATDKLPLHREELKQMFLSRIDSINRFRVDQIASHLKNVQNHQDLLFTEAMLDNRKFLGAFMQLYMISFSDEVIENIFSQIPAGTPQKERQDAISRAEAEIKRLNKLLKTELNIPERFVYSKDGKPFGYPQGCRWWAFYQVWRRVAVRFSGPVDIEGTAIENQLEMDAYISLGLDKLQKVTPVEKPRTRNTIQ